MTVRKYQGGEIDDHYNIYDINRMDKKQLYTSLSRTTKVEYIHLDENPLLKSYYNKNSLDLELMLDKIPCLKTVKYTRYLSTMKLYVQVVLLKN